MPEIAKMLILSTGHLREETDRIMLADRTGGYDGESLLQLSYDCVVCGYFVWVIEDESIEVDSELPEEFKAIFAYARKHDCRYIYFDRDGEIVDELPHWEW